MTDTEESDETYTTRDTRTLSGGGTVSWQIEGARHRVGQGLDRGIRAAIENRNARYFNEAGDAGPRKPVTIPHQLPAVGDVVELLNDGDRYNVEGLQYEVEDGYYPDEYDHMILLSGVPDDQLQSAFLNVQTRLLERGFFVNSVRTSDSGRLEKLHVVRKQQADITRAYGREKHEEEAER